MKISGNYLAEFLRTATDWDDFPRHWAYSSFSKQVVAQCPDCKDWQMVFRPQGMRPPGRCEECTKKRYKERYSRTDYHRKARAKTLSAIDFHCVVCGESFEALRSSAKTCSAKCRQRLKRNPEHYAAKIAHPTWTEQDDRKLSEAVAAEKERLNQCLRVVGSKDEGLKASLFAQLKSTRLEIERLEIIKGWVLRKL